MTRCLRGLYLLTPDDGDSDALAARCAQALRGGPAMLQYRCKIAEPDLRREQAARLLALCREAGVPLVINDDLALALELGADGVHLGRDDGDPAAARAALGASRILGVSCYDRLELAHAACAAGADYVAFGAVYPSPTKPGAAHAPLELIARASNELGVPVAAIGGITLDNATTVTAAGASLLAVISDVFERPDPAARAGAYRALFADAAAARQHL